jgi:hypothetical protein
LEPPPLKLPELPEFPGVMTLQELFMSMTLPELPKPITLRELPELAFPL